MVGWTVGTFGLVYQTTDGGETWVRQQRRSTGTLNSVFFLDNNTGWAVGAGGGLVSTTDGGSDWTKQAVPTKLGLNAIHFVSPDLGIAVGDHGVILRTTDGGAEWDSVESGTTRALYGVRMMDGLHGWIVGKFGTILSTSDGGATWNAEVSPTIRDLMAVTSSDSIAWVVGMNGTILQSIDTSFSPLTRKAHSGGPISSVRNYPNPFNPITNVAFELKEKGLISVTIYNILGQEVAMLVNNQQFGAGWHSVQFRAGERSSGVYFYRVTSQPATQTITGKMLLLK
jgi:hypothetical protein